MSATKEAERRKSGTGVERLARFVCRSDWSDISEPAREQLKLRNSRLARCGLRCVGWRAGGDGPSAGAGVRRGTAGDADRRGEKRAGSRGPLQRGTRPLPGLQRLLPCTGGEL